MLNTVRHTTNHPEVSDLRRFQPLGSLEYSLLQQLAMELSIQQAPPGTRLLAQGNNEDSLLYLMQGKLILKAVDGGVQHISADSDSARSPIARLRPSRYDVVAETAVTYLVVPAKLMTAPEEEEPSKDGLELYEVVEEHEEAHEVAEDQLAFQLYEDLKSNKLLLPSLPDVAVLVGQTVNQDHADAHRVAKVIENDPVISAKIIKVANSARYAGATSIAALPDAVARIGLSTVHSLVITFALRELFRSQSPVLNRIMKDQWEQARELGAICHVLASRCKHINPETALLAGLVHNIGSVAIITHARDYPGLAEDTEVLQQVIENLKSPVGKMILTYWEFPKAVVEAAGDDPMRQHDGPCDMGDLVTIARHHVDSLALEDEEAPELSLPAYSKLSVEPEQIQSVLEEAQSQLQETMSLLSS